MSWHCGATSYPAAKKMPSKTKPVGEPADKAFDQHKPDVDAKRKPDEGAEHEPDADAPHGGELANRINEVVREASEKVGVVVESSEDEVHDVATHKAYQPRRMFRGSVAEAMVKCRRCSKSPSDVD